MRVKKKKNNDRFKLVHRRMTHEGNPIVRVWQPPSLNVSGIGYGQGEGESRVGGKGQGDCYVYSKADTIAT